MNSETIPTPPNGTGHQHEKMEQGVDVWDFRPNVGDSVTDEPSVRSIICRYYRAHFDHDQAAAFTREYFSKFDPAFTAAPDMLAALKRGATRMENAAKVYNVEPDRTQWREWAAEAHAAIARAEGAP